MPLEVNQFRTLIVRPTLKFLGLYSLAAEELVLGTALVESNLTFIRQKGAGPALGLFQMEPATHDDIWNNYINYREDLSKKLKTLSSGGVPLSADMVGNMFYAAAMCRIQYKRVPDPLPLQGDFHSMGLYWKKHYNTELGAGKPSHFTQLSEELVK